jgi:hypothetical protein
MEMVVVLVRPVSVQVLVVVKFDEASPKLTLGSVHSVALISVTDKVAVLVVPSWRVLSEMVADKVGVVVGWLF